GGAVVRARAAVQGVRAHPALHDRRCVPGRLVACPAEGAHRVGRARWGGATTEAGRVAGRAVAAMAARGAGGGYRCRRGWLVVGAQRHPVRRRTAERLGDGTAAPGAAAAARLLLDLVLVLLPDHDLEILGRAGDVRAAAALTDRDRAGDG